jgi:hypothetical protein
MLWALTSLSIWTRGSGAKEQRLHPWLYAFAPIQGLQNDVFAVLQGLQNNAFALLQRLQKFSRSRPLASNTSDILHLLLHRMIRMAHVGDLRQRVDHHFAHVLC